MHGSVLVEKEVDREKEAEVSNFVLFPSMCFLCCLSVFEEGTTGQANCKQQQMITVYSKRARAVGCYCSSPWGPMNLSKA